MTQNGPYPGPPAQPWSAGGSGDSYAAPADPWGERGAGAPQAPWGAPAFPAAPPAAAHPSAPHQFPAATPVAAPMGPGGTVGAFHPAAPGTPGWGPPAAPRQRNTAVVVLVGALALLACGGLASTAWLLSPMRNTAQKTPTAPSAAAPAPAAGADLPLPRSSSDARFVAKGQCVRNEGSAEQPDMRIVACASGTYEVLKRVDGRTTGESDAQAKCGKVPRYTKWYFYDSELDSLDFVLCLRER